jgi:hypothetical protein
MGAILHFTEKLFTPIGMVVGAVILFIAYKWFVWMGIIGPGLKIGGGGDHNSDGNPDEAPPAPVDTHKDPGHP